MTDAEEKYKASVEKSQQEAHEETMWGKPARDIVTGIGNNGGIHPVRAIWELVQNARDVVADGKRAKIMFIRKVDSLVFQHDGIPFTHKTIEALILQTSSKQSINNVQVGQYGTGFLTTHMFGLRFRLSAPLKTSEDFPRYFKIPNFEIDRSATDPERMKKDLHSQWETTQDWGKNYNETTEQPCEHTTFSYLYESEQAKLNAKSAFEQAPDMVPFVLTLNRNIESISFLDEINQQETIFECRKSEMDYVENLTDGIIYKYTVHRTRKSKVEGVEDKDLYIYSICSNDHTEDEPKRPKVHIILPLIQNNDGSLRVVEFKHNLPQIYIYLPLLGTEKWGFNYIVHSSLFTCDKDSRDSLRLVGNGQNNDDQAESNRKIIALANKLINQFIDQKALTLQDAKYLVRSAFPTNQADQKLGNYYNELQTNWVKKYETLMIAEDSNNNKIAINIIKVLDPKLCDACKKDDNLLNAIYDMFTKSNTWRVSKKSDMIYWSETINRWYCDAEGNPHTLTITDIANRIQELAIEEKDLSWLHEICLYIVNSQQNTLLDKYALIPNEERQLQKKASMLHPVELSPIVKNVLNLMVPEKTKLFVNNVFYDLLEDITYDYPNVKTDISTFTNNHNTAQNAARNEMKLCKKNDIDNPNQHAFIAKNYEDKKLSDELVKAMLVIFKSLLYEESESKPAELYNLLTEYYGFNTCEQIDRLSKEYGLDARTFYNTLTYDCLFKFSLEEDKSTKAEWNKRLVSLIYNISDSRSLLNYYQIYQDQQGVFKYAEWIKKQSDTVPNRVLDIYDIIIREVTKDDTSNSIKKSLLAKDYNDCFVGTAILDGMNECSQIAGELEKKGYSLSNYEHENLIVEIIENFTSGSETDKWKKLFADIDAHKGQLMFSVIQSQTKKNSIFKIMKIEDEKRLKAIAELANDPRMEEIIEAGRKAVAQFDYEKRRVCFIRDLGNYVEQILLQQLQGAVNSERLKVEVTDQQGGQDYKVLLDNKVVYYIEVKSRWTTSDSVEMSSLQFKTSVAEKEHYSLCYVDMTWKNIGDVSEREYDDLDTCISHTKVLNDIGKRNEWCIDSVQNDDSRTHIGGGYSLIVPQKLFNQENATDFNGLVDHIKQAIEKVMNQN